MNPDSFRWLPLVLACVAIVVSGLSWWESHRNRIISEAVNRPVLTIDITEESFKAPITSKQVMTTTFVMTEVTNFGKTPAIIEKIEHEFVFFLQPEQCRPHEQRSFMSPIEGKEILPTFKAAFDASFATHPDCAPPMSFVFQGSIYYTEAGGANHYKQEFSKLLYPSAK